MTREEARKIKVGDVVGAIVQSVGKMGVWLETPGEEENRWVPLTAIVSHTPAPKPALKVGDRVKNPTGSEWEIVFIQNDGHGYAHFAHKPDNAMWPTRLDVVETWERLS